MVNLSNLDSLSLSAYERKMLTLLQNLSVTSSTTSTDNNSIDIIPNIRNVNLPQSGKEYPQSFSNLRLIEIFCRSLAEVHYAFNTVDIAANKYRTIPPGVSQAINFPCGCKWTGSIYLASIANNAIVEIETWT